LPEAAFFALNVSGQAPLAVQFLDISNPGDSDIQSWAWDFGDGTNGTERNPLKTYAAAGTYTVALTVTNAVGSNTLTQMGLISVQALVPALLVGSSPGDGEDGVAVTREVVLNFSAPLDPGSVSGSSVALSQGTQPVSTYFNVSPDGLRLTLFPSSPLPGNRTVRLLLDGEQLLTTDGRKVDVDGDGAPGGARTITYTTLGLSSAPGTTVSGRVFASELATGEKGAAVNMPLQGVEIWVDGRFDIVATTDVNGNFQLGPVPPGRFFVHINGLEVANAYVDGAPVPTSFPEGPYYPLVGKVWEAAAGRDTIVGDVYLPLIPAGALAPVSDTEATEVKFSEETLAAHPEYAGVRVVVPAGSLYSDFGTRGGLVGIAPVAADRLPSPLPPGLDLPLVITVQSSGPNNFDQPVPACFPNVAAPGTGEALPPGSASALWSFDHDQGDWVVVGTMTVSEDGALVCTDPGVGILEPGWHGTRPASSPGFVPSIPGLDGAGRRCIPEEDECVSSIGWAAFDCAISFVPGLGGARFAVECGSGFVDFAFSTTRDCLLPGVGPDPDASDAAGCGLSTLFGSAELLTGCSETLTRMIPGLGTVIACGSGAIDIARNCTCVFDKRAKGAPGEAEIAAFEELVAFLDAYRAYIVLELGNPKWCDFEVTSDSFAEDAARVFGLLQALYEFNDTSSEERVRISTAEAAQLAALPLPTGFTGADITALAAYRNMTVEQWGLGKFTHTAAGRTDFIDRDTLVAALDLLISRGAIFNAKGGTVYDAEATIRQFIEVVLERFTDTASGATPHGELDYVVTEMRTGLSSRGRLTPGGALRIVALAPDRYYRLEFFDLDTRGYARAGIQSGLNGSTTELPPILLSPTDGEPDTDGDGLADLAEGVYGTFADDDDSDDDGASDLAEVEQGTNPLDGLVQGTGILASVSTPGSALDVTATNDYVAVADGSEGVAVFNVYKGMPPALVAQVDTPGSARKIAASGPWLAVADGNEGLAIIDVSNPILSRKTAQFGGGEASDALLSVATSGNYAYGGQQNGKLIVFDMVNGRSVGYVTMPGPVGALAAAGDTLGAACDPSVIALSLEDGMPVIRGSQIFPGLFAVYPSIFNSGSLLYTGNNEGYHILDIADLDAPVPLGFPDLAIGTSHDVVSNGNGLVLAAISRNAVARPLGIFDDSDPTETDALIDEIDTPGNVEGVALYNGLAYIADGPGGLAVAGYRATDTGGNAPTVSIDVAGGAGAVAANALILVRAEAADDVEVRSVEFLVNGVRAETDGAFPYEFRLRVPNLAPSSQITLGVAAVDTGGNRSATASQTFTVNVDTAAPLVNGSKPGDGRIALAVDGVTIYVNEPLKTSAAALSSFSLTGFGGDHAAGGGDDFDVPLSGPTFAQGNTAISLKVAAGGPLADGVYLFEAAAAGLSDRAGNIVAGNVQILFQALTSDNGRAIFNKLGGGAWNDASNWLGGRPPVAGQPVSIDISGVETTIEIPPGFYAAGAIDSNEALSISAAAYLSVSGSSVLRRNVNLGGQLALADADTSLQILGTLNTQSGSIITMNAGSSLTLAANTMLDGVAFNVSDATLNLPLLQTFSNGALYVSGAMSTVLSPNLANLNGSSLTMYSASLAFPQVASLAGFEATVSTGAALGLGNVASAVDSAFHVQSVGSTLDVGSLATAHNLTASVSIGGSLSFPALYEVTVDASAGFGLKVLSGTLEAQALETLSLDGVPNGVAAFALEATGEGLLDLQGLATITRTGNTNLQLSASNGAQVNLAVLTELAPGTGIYATSGGQFLLDALTAMTANANLDGADTVIDAPLLASISGYLSMTGPLQFEAPQLATATDFTLYMSQGAAFTAASLDIIEGGSLYLVDAATLLSADAVSMLKNTSLRAEQGAAIILPGLASYIVDNTNASIAVDGPGSAIGLPILGAMEVAGAVSNLGITATNEGNCDLSAVVEITTPTDNNTVAISANGSGSQIDLGALAIFDLLRVSTSATDGGSIVLP
jgi:PKD repeat protein